MRLDGRLPPGRRGEENGTLATGVSASAGEDDLDGGFVVAAAWDTMLCMDDRAGKIGQAAAQCLVQGLYTACTGLVQDLYKACTDPV